MIKVENSNIEIPNVINGKAYLNDYNRVELIMDEGFYFWDKKDYIVDGVYTEPSEEDLILYTEFSFAPDRDFSLLIEKGVELSEESETELKAQAYDILMGVSE